MICSRSILVTHSLRFSFLLLGRMAFILTMILSADSAGKAADVYDASTDYSIDSNPNGVWSSGYLSTLSSQFVLFDQKRFVQDNVHIWVSSEVQLLDDPAFGKNSSSSPVNGINPNQVFLHPGPNGEYSVLRFISPSTGFFFLEVQFFEGDIGGTDGYVILNGDSADPVYYAPSTSGNPKFDDALYLLAGDTVDIAVGSLGDFYFDTTPINVSFTEQAVPEPQPIILALVAAGGFAVFARRRSAIKRS